MPFLRVKDIREMAPDRRIERIDELRTELARLKATAKAGGSIENPSRIREIRKAIARLLTVQNEGRRDGP
jgi:large subunit ribosomal protein L29